MKAFNIVLSFSIVVASASAVSAAVVWSDDFESYANQAGFDADWPVTGGTAPTWSTDQSTSPTHSILEPSGSPGRVSSVTTYPLNDVNGSDTSRLVVEYDLYINPADLTSSRRYIELREEDGGAGNILALGLTNLGSLDNTKFGFRNLFTWTQLSAPRRAGWNHVKATLDSTDITFKINSYPKEVFARASTGGYGRIYMGSGFSNNTVDPFDGFTLIDDLSVQNVPEPASLALIGAGALALIGAIRRRR